MDKRKSLFIILLLIGLMTIAHSQKLNFNSDKKIDYALNQNVADALFSNNSSKMDRLLTADPNSVNCGVGQNCPLLYKTVELCLSHKVSIEMVKVVLKHHPNYYCLYNNETSFYCILRYLATHTISACETAESLFYKFYNLPDFNVLEVFDRTPPPLAFLLNTNHVFLNGRFDNNYISSDIVIALVEKGVSVNSRDQNSSTLMAYATACRNQTLIDYCLGKNVDLSIKNKQGLDAFCIAVQDNQLFAVKKILSSNYTLDENRIEKTALKTILPHASNEVATECFNAVKNGVKDITALRILKQAFPKQFGYFITDGYSRNNFNVNGTEIPALIQLFNEYSNNSVASKNLNDLKKEYIFSASNLADLYLKLNQYPLYSINYTKNYYEKESSFYSLISSLEKNKDNFPLSFYNSMISEAKNECSGYINEDRSSVSAYVQLLNDYGKFFKENPSKYNELETKVFNRFIRYVEYFGYSNEDFPEDISSAISMAKKNLSNSTAFMQKFTNPEFLNIAAEQKKKSLNYIERMEPVYKEALINYSDFIVKYNQLISYIVKDGRVPNYQYTSDKHDVIEIECWPTDITCNVSYEDGKYELSVRGLLGNYGRVSGASLGECVKKIVMDEKGLYYIAGDVSNYDRYSVKLSSDDYRKFKEHYTHLVTKYNKDWWNCTLREL